MDVSIFNTIARPITVELSDGRTITFPRSQNLAPFVTQHVVNDDGRLNDIPIRDLEYGDVINMPEEEDGAFFIVSNLVYEIMDARNDLLAPDVKHERVQRKDNGQITSVPGLLGRHIKLFEE